MSSRLSFSMGTSSNIFAYSASRFFRAFFADIETKTITSAIIAAAKTQIIITLSTRNFNSASTNSPLIGDKPPVKAVLNALLLFTLLFRVFFTRSVFIIQLFFFVVKIIAAGRILLPKFKKYATIKRRNARGKTIFYPARQLMRGDL